MSVVALAPLHPDHQRALRLAVARLERPSFVAALAQYAGSPVDIAIKYLPDRISSRLRQIIKAAIFRCLDAAVDSLEDEDDPGPPAEWTSKLMTGLSGGIGGFFGMAGLPIELPLTTALMLRSIAEIARAEGEDVKTPETMLACLEVFALGGGGRSGKAQNLGLEYYATRTVLSSLTRDVGRHMMERGAINASTPIIARLVGEIVSRFGLAVSDRFASGIVPVIGAVSGATVNMIFMDHFQQLARGHFTVRRLEREYGASAIREHYQAAALELGRRRL